MLFTTNYASSYQLLSQHNWENPVCGTVGNSILIFAPKKQDFSSNKMNHQALKLGLKLPVGTDTAIFLYST